MLSGINQWAFPGSMPVDEACRIAGEVGFESIELCLDEQNYISLDSSDEQIAVARHAADRHGLQVLSVATGLGWKYPLTSPDLKVREQGLEILANSLRITHLLGADSLLVVPGIVTPEVDYHIALENALETIQKATEIAEKYKVNLAIENVWNRFLLSPVEMRDFIDQCESEWVGAYFDVGNILAYGYPEQWIRILGNRIRKIHLKDFRLATGTLDGFVMLLEGDVNWPEVMNALKDVGYDGPLTAEYGAYTHGLEPMLHQVHTAIQALVKM